VGQEEEIEVGLARGEPECGQYDHHEQQVPAHQYLLLQSSSYSKEQEQAQDLPMSLPHNVEILLRPGPAAQPAV
jgi:hypothetical protein